MAKLDNLIFEKTWIDSNPYEDLFELKITAKNDRITMSSTVYAQTRNIKKIQHGIQNLSQRSFTITFGSEDENSLNCVKLTFSLNKRGIVNIAVYMKTQVNENTCDSAEFSILAELAMLDRFASDLEQISDGDIGVCVQLLK